LAGECGDPDDGRVAPLLLRLERTAEVLDLSPSTVKRLIRAGDLAAVKVAGSTRVRVEDLRAFVERLATKDDAR
jgi:excisionase family DNA binding protein